MKISRVDENTRYSFSDSVPPVLTIEPGDRIVVQTRDASDGQIRPGRATPPDRARFLPVTGPIAVRGAKPGDALSIRIEGIALAPAGHAWLREGLGIRKTPVEGPYHVRELPVVGDSVRFGEDLSLPLRPMVGIVGVTPPGESPTRAPGVHGGNLDCVDVAEGSTLWLPVLVPGALLCFGDVHAAMGEGEVSGTGVEIEAELTVTVNLHPGSWLDGPVVVTPEKTLFLATDPDPSVAIRAALDRAVAALVAREGHSEQDAVLLASLAGNARICQLVNGVATTSYEVPRSVLRW